MNIRTTPRVLGLAVTVLVWSTACGGIEEPTFSTDDAIIAPEGEGGSSETDEDQAPPEICSMECNGAGYWEGENRTTTGAVQQGTPVQVGSSLYRGAMSFLPVVTNPTGNPSVFTPSSSTCTTTSGSVTFSSSSGVTMNAGVNIGGLSLGGSGTVASSSGTTQTVTTCQTAGSQQSYTLDPGDELYCTNFDGTLRLEFDVPRFRIDSSYYWARYCKKCTSTVIHICGGYLCGPWVQGTGTQTRVDLESVKVVLEVPIAGSKCSSTAYPLSPG